MKKALITCFNSEVTFSGFRKGFVITVKDNRKIYFEYNASYMGLSDDQLRLSSMKMVK